MKTKQTLQDVLLWKKEDMNSIRERILLAISETDAGDTMKRLLLENAENSGKMLRPLVMLMVAGDYAPQKREELLWGAAAGEMIHTASLLLDDVIDDAPLRRGKPSMLAKYGSSASICGGAFLMANAYSCLVKRGYHDTAAHLLDVTELVCDGELLQDMNRYNADISEDVYMRSIRGKTAMAFAFSGEVASKITGHDRETQTIFTEFGTVFGMAFQLYDDILDWTMTEKELGKPVCEDFINGIYTLPAIFTFQNTEYREKLLSLADKKGSLHADEIAAAKDLVQQSGGIRYARHVIDLQAKKAQQLLDRLPESRYISVLKLLVDSLHG